MERIVNNCHALGANYQNMIPNHSATLCSPCLIRQFLLNSQGPNYLTKKNCPPISAVVKKETKTGKKREKDELENHQRLEQKQVSGGFFY